MNAEIEDMIRQCDECQREHASQAFEPMIEVDAQAKYPFEEVSMDIFQHAGKYFRATVDRFSGWPCITKFMRCPTTHDIINISDEMFGTYGIPVRVQSNGGPQYSSNDWLEYLTRKGADRRLSSPFNPTGNAHAESGVKALKSLVKKTGGSTKSEAFFDGLREWRNTPKAHGLSPSELMFGRNIRSTVPTLPSVPSCAHRFADRVIMTGFKVLWIQRPLYSQDTYERD